MYSDDYNPYDHYPNDDDMDVVIYPEHVTDDDIYPNRTRLWRRLRNGIFAVLMISVLGFSILAPAWQIFPSLLGYWKTSYRVSITDIRAGDCSTRYPTLNPEAIPPAASYCICGILSAGNETADFDIRLMDNDGQRLGIIRLREQESGRFCNPIELNNLLPIDTYTLSVLPRLMLRDVLRVQFTVTNDKPTV